MLAHALHHRTAPASAAVPSAVPSGTRAKTLDASPLRLALAASGVSEEFAAHRLGVSRALVRKLEDGRAPVSIERVEALHRAAPRAGRELARQMIERLRPLAEEVPPSAPSPDAALRTVITRVGDVARELDEALADGSVSAEERSRVQRARCALAEAVLVLGRAV